MNEQKVDEIKRLYEKLENDKLKIAIMQTSLKVSMVNSIEELGGMVTIRGYNKLKNGKKNRKPDQYRVYIKCPLNEFLPQYWRPLIGSSNYSDWKNIESVKSRLKENLTRLVEKHFPDFVHCVI